MAEPNVNNAAGDFVDARNGLQENQEALAINPEIQNQLMMEPVQPLVCQIAQPAAGDSPQLEKDNNANTTATEANNNEAKTVSQLQDEITKRTIERDELRKQLEESERKLSQLEKAKPQHDLTPNGNNESQLLQELETLRAALAESKLTLEDRERRIAAQENQISALSKQVSSLKEVVAITKDMLSIRNMEVKHLQEDVDRMDSKISAERERHSDMLSKMDAAVRLNADLKKEYQTQLQLFQDLRGKYEEKVTLLSEENKALETAVQAQPAL